MLPMLVDESTTQTFVFYQDGSLYRGLNFRQQLFKLVQYFDGGSRSKAFEFGCELGDRWMTIITVSPQGYGVWVNLHATVACSGMELFAPDPPNGAARNTNDTEQGGGHGSQSWKGLGQLNHGGFDEPPKYNSKRLEDEGFNEIKM